MPHIKPLGQPPKVWKLIEKMDKNGKLIKFTIQEIPEDRYEDTVQHMCAYFLADEPICNYFDAKNDPLFVQDISITWRLSLTQGISIAAFIDNPNGGKPIIIGINVLSTEVKNRKPSIFNYQFKSEKCKKTLEILSDVKLKVVYERYNVDKYLCGSGLSIHPDYRGYGLGKDMLQIRDLIGPMYGIPVTVSVFTSIFSQKLAANAGFVELLTKNFSDLVDKDEKECFSDINCVLNIMGKQLS